MTFELLPFLSLGPTRLTVKKNSPEFLSLSREAHSFFVPYLLSARGEPPTVHSFFARLRSSGRFADLDLMEPIVDVDRFIRSSLDFAPLLACRSRPHGTYC